MRILLLNGPKRSGKDTTANFLAARVEGGVRIGIADHLKRVSHIMAFGPAGYAMDPNHFDAVKEIPHPAFAGMSPRQFYIHVSERVLKPLYGEDYFGNRFVDAVEAARAEGAKVVFVPDSGFREEAEPVVRKYGVENVRLVRVHREGCTYEGDSRKYIALADLGVWETDAQNVTGAPEVMQINLLGIVREWVGDGFGIERAA